MHACHVVCAHSAGRRRRRRGSLIKDLKRHARLAAAERASALPTRSGPNSCAAPCSASARHTASAKPQTAAATGLPRPMRHSANSI